MSVETLQLSIIIPVLDEEENLIPLVEEIKSVLEDTSFESFLSTMVQPTIHLKSWWDWKNQKETFELSNIGGILEKQLH